jgi:hypothetical protein
MIGRKIKSTVSGFDGFKLGSIHTITGENGKCWVFTDSLGNKERTILKASCHGSYAIFVKPELPKNIKIL